MSKINVTLPDGSVKQVDKGTTSMEIAKGISHGLAKNVLSAKVNEEVWDASRPLNDDCTLELLTWNNEDGKKTMWHSSAHLMAEALEDLFPGVKFGIGPPIDNGFYYDIDAGDRVITAEDLPEIEKKMKELASQKNSYERKEVSKKDALEYFKDKDDEYKLELIEDLEDGEITFYTQGNFTDLCRGPHIPNTGYIKAIKLLNVAGAYWRGDEKRKQLTRIYGITFPKQKELDEHLEMLEEAKKRDHRKLGKELGIFTFSQKVGQGLPMWLPKGAALRERLERFLRTAQEKAGYQTVMTPHIGSKELYETSGHYEKYGKDSFQPIHTPDENEEFLLKPMNCPHHCEIYKSSPRSYRDLPLRLAEFGTVYRYEQSGELHGLTRVRGFTQDDAHIFCRPDQVEEEFIKVIDLVKYVLNALEFEDYTAQISLRDPEDKSKYIGSDENWEKAEAAIVNSVESKGLKAVVEYGEAAFYGPKLDFMVKDALGRSWQLGTIQVDYNLPERFELEYTGSDNMPHRPVMIHRAPFGSMERFVAVLIEHCNGKFPLWLTDLQFMVLPISDRFNDSARNVLNSLKNYDIRGLVDERGEKIGKKIREASMQKVPYQLIIGEKEVEEGNLSVRKHGEGEIGKFTIEEFADLIKKEENSLLNKVDSN